MCLDLIVAQSADSRDQRQGDIGNHRDLQELDENVAGNLKPARQLTEENTPCRAKNEADHDLPG